MKHLSIPVSAFLAATVAVTAFAQTTTVESTGRLDFDAGIDLDSYSDAPWSDFETNLAVSVLTEEGILRGNDPSPGSGQARTFRPDRRLNRAEFVQIVMRLSSASPSANRNCFPDVHPNDWYADPVCRAKAMGIVRGNARAGVDQSLWRFEPSRDVQYEEAVKILVELYALPIVGDGDGTDWYVPYIEAAEDMGLAIDGLEPGDRITRAEMARLTLAFMARNEGQLEEYRDAEANGGRSSSSSSSSRSSMSSLSSSRSSAQSSFSSDPDGDLTVRSNFLLLGRTTPVLGAVDFFAQSEPVEVDTVTVRFASDPSSIQQVRVYAEDDGRFLGSATRDGSGDYQVNVAAGTVILPHREEYGVYVRALMKPADGGASGGEIVRVERITAEGDGVWSDSEYTVSSTGTFLSFKTTPAAITVFRSTGSLMSSAFIAGPNLTLGEFDVRAVSTDNDYEVQIEKLVIRVAASSEITLSDVELTVPGSGASTSCTVSSGVLTCDNIPDSVGTVDGMTRLRLVGDVALAGGATDPYLQVTLQASGSATSPGDIEWTDGQRTYDWIAVDEPVARGIHYE